MTGSTTDASALVEYLRAHAAEPNAWDGHGRADQLDSYRQSMRRAADALFAVTAELDQTRQAIEDAPHDWACGSKYFIRSSMYRERVPLDGEQIRRPCGCWKAAL